MSDSNPSTKWLGAMGAGLILASPAAQAAPSAVAPVPFGIYSDPSTSMQPSIDEGDLILADASKRTCAGRAVSLGAVVLQRRPGLKEYFVRRVVAGPGDTVAVLRGLVVLNGHALSRPAPARRAVVESPFGIAPNTGVYRETAPKGQSWEVAVSELPDGTGSPDTAPIKIPAGTYFLLGDNRRNAIDSRVYGPVKQEDLCASVTRILSSRHLEQIGKRP